MSKHRKLRPGKGDAPLNSARNLPEGPLEPVPLSGTAPADAKPPEDDAYLHRTAPNQQRFAQAFLAGTTPGLMQRYAPDAHASATQGWVEDDETVECLRSFREEFPYGG